jgi:sulfite reductase (ferredoxin)
MLKTLAEKGIALEDQKDILELDRRIKDYRSGKEDEERFKLYRLTRGVYGQRQIGVQMFRIKIPYGKLSPDQLIRIADVSDQYATGNLHITTRQDIQLHHVRLENSPLVWTALAEKKITAREACGNTVRNVTASAEAGIDPLEPFDVSPYADALAHYFLRNPICQEMGRKIKIAFSSSESDTALSFMHDFGFIPRIVNAVKGFKVVVGGGLGAQAMFAETAYEFLSTDEILPFVEAALRIFDRYGEREKRHKARMKFLIKSMGLEHFLSLVADETKALLNQKIVIAASDEQITAETRSAYEGPSLVASAHYQQWLRTNTFEQKQKDYHGVYIKVLLGDLSSALARALAPIISRYAADDIRLTINQNMLLKYVHKAHLLPLFHALDTIGLAQVGYDSIADVTACPGTDTCNLGVTDSTHLAKEIEQMIESEYPDLLEEKHIKIKISGCMNACGQHMIANIGFHGSSIKRGEHVIPAMQIVLGGGVDPLHQAYIADKVIKIPTKRILNAIRKLLDHYHEWALEGEYYNHYYERVGGKKFFYDLLKPLADVNDILPEELIDWGQQADYVQEIGVGECAGAMLDMVSTIIGDAREKLAAAAASLEAEAYADSAYYSYSSMVVASKALLLSVDVSCNTQKGIIDDFDIHFVKSGAVILHFDYAATVLSINTQPADQSFTLDYLAKAHQLLDQIMMIREKQLANAPEQAVIAHHYTA